MKLKLAYKKNMRDQILTNDRAIAVCPACGAEYSANAGDYWNMPDDKALTCCEVICELVTKHIVYRGVK